MTEPRFCVSCGAECPEESWGKENNRGSSAETAAALDEQFETRADGRCPVCELNDSARRYVRATGERVAMLFAESGARKEDVGVTLVSPARFADGSEGSVSVELVLPEDFERRFYGEEK